VQTFGGGAREKDLADRFSRIWKKISVFRNYGPLGTEKKWKGKVPYTCKQMGAESVVLRPVNYLVSGESAFGGYPKPDCPN